MNQMYNIDFVRFIVWLIPPRLRNQFNIDWFKALCSPIMQLYNDFTRFREEINYRLAINSQVCYMEKILNDTFDNEQRRIYISDVPLNGLRLLQTDELNEPVMLQTDAQNDPLIIHKDSSYTGSKYDFIVNVPFVITDAHINQMRVTVKTNKLPTKRFEIYKI